MVTSTDIVNEALALFGDDGALVTGVAPNFDSSTAGKAAALVYKSTVAAVARQFAWPFSRQNEPLLVTSNMAPFPWSYEYIYPANCVDIWQLEPSTLADPNDPTPQTWAIGNNLVSGIQTKVIWSNLANARAVFDGNPSENTWDSLFRETVVRVLASKLAMALAGKPDVSQSLLETAGAFQNIGVEREG